MQTWDIHGRKKRRDRIEELLKESDIEPENVKLILRYVDYRTTQSNITELRQEKLISSLRTFAGFLGKPFTEATKADIERILSDVYNMNPKGLLRQERAKQRGDISRIVYEREKDGGPKLKDSTKNSYAKCLKMFYVWLKGNKHPKVTDWIQPPSYKSAKLRTEDKIFWADVEKLSKAATNKRDYCIPQILLDSGARIEELLTLRIMDVEFITLKPEGDKGKAQTAAKVHIRKSKTEERSPILFNSVPAIKNWIENHPLRQHPESPLFVNLKKNNHPLTYKDARTILITLKTRSKLEKKVNPHLFRKSACSLCGDMGMGDSQIDKRFGWSMGSRVKTAYLFPEEAKANDAYLRGSGVDLEDKKERKHEPKPMICSFCGAVNPIGRDFCLNPKCRMPVNLDQKAADDKRFLKETVLEILEELLSGKDLKGMMKTKTGSMRR
jgi:integrase